LEIHVIRFLHKKFDGSKERRIADNIYNAQQAGAPQVLTYDYEKDKNIRRQNMTLKREKAMNSKGEEVPPIDGQRLHRDEYMYCRTHGFGMDRTCPRDGKLEPGRTAAGVFRRAWSDTGKNQYR
jgi:hypothetical protein